MKYPEFVACIDSFSKTFKKAVDDRFKPVAAIKSGGGGGGGRGVGMGKGGGAGGKGIMDSMLADLAQGGFGGHY